MKTRIVKLLERDIKEKHLSNHPFYQLWNEGKISVKALQGYTQQYYHFVAEIPRLVGRVYSNTSDMKDRLTILENLNEEENPKLPHEELWIRFGEGLGVKRKHLKAKMLPETRTMMNSMWNLCKDDSLSGCAALLAYESQISEIACLKMKGLKKYYNIKDKRSLEFFEVHKVSDIEHQKTWKKIIAKHAKTAPEKAKVRKALNKSLNSMWLMLDGIQKKYC